MTQRQKRYASQMISGLIGEQESLLRREYSRTAREDIREMIQFLYQLPDQFEGVTR